MTQCFSIRWFWAFRETYLDQNVSFKIRFQKLLSVRLLLLIGCAVRSKKQMTFLSGKKVTFMNWQESDVHEMARTFMKNKVQRIMNWNVSNKTTALSSLRTAQAGKSETRQNEKKKGTTKSKKVLSVSRQIQWSKFDVDFIDLNLLHKGSYWLFWT